jgi:hypothetical protein
MPIIVTGFRGYRGSRNLFDGKSAFISVDTEHVTKETKDSFQKYVHCKKCSASFIKLWNAQFISLVILRLLLLPPSTLLQTLNSLWKTLFVFLSSLSRKFISRGKSTLYSFVIIYLLTVSLKPFDA